MATSKFQKLITSEIEDTNFDSIYDKIEESNVYDPVQIKKIIQYTIYHLEIKKKITQDVGACLNYHLNILRGCDENRKELDKIELLYVIQLCKKLNEDLKKDSMDNLLGLYN
jgi:hypothetical protein